MTTATPNQTIVADPLGLETRAVNVANVPMDVIRRLRPHARRAGISHTAAAIMRWATVQYLQVLEPRPHLAAEQVG